MSFFDEAFSIDRAQGTSLGLEFSSPKVAQLKTNQISPSRSLWDQYGKRNEILDYHRSDFLAIMQAIAKDGYAKSAVSKYVNSIFLRGYQIHSLKKDLVKLIQLRLRFISEATGENTDAFFHRIAYDLVAYANVYIQKIRQKQPTDILPKRLKTVKGLPFIKSGQLQPRDPIAGYDLVHPASMHIFRDRFGNLIRYEQWPIDARVRPTDNKQIRTFTPDEIIHVVIDREDNFAYGTPFLGAVIDDIRMLRLIEDHTSRLCFRYAFPFTQIRIGETKPGFQASEEDLIFYRQLIEKAPSDSSLVTNEKVQFNVVGAQGNAIDMAPYLEYFENRAFTGLQVPAVTMGRGDSASRGTADAMTTEMHDQIKHFQNVISRVITDEIYQELLRESGFSIYDDEKNWCSLVFEEIEVESKIKRENHVLQLVQGNLLTVNEGRILIGKQPFTDGDWNDTYLRRVLLPQAIIKDTGLMDLDAHGQLKLAQHKTNLALQKAKIDQVKTDTTAIAAAPAAKVKKPVGSPGKVKTGVPKGTDNRNRPANQHGKRLGPKRKTELALPESIREDLHPTLVHFHKAISEIYTDLRLATIEQGKIYLGQANKTAPKLAELLFNLVEDRLTSVSRSYLIPAFKEGIEDFSQEAQKQVSDLWLNERKVLQGFNERTMGRLIRDVCRPSLKAIEKAEDPDTLESKLNTIFEAQSYRLALISNTEVPQSYWFGYASAAYIAGVPLTSTIDEEGCQDCQKVPTFENSSSATVRLKKVPTYHPQCLCGLRVN